MTHRVDTDCEWFEPDGLGGFACGTVGGVRTRRYHGLLLTATQPPTGRMMLVNGYDAWVETQRGRFALVSQRYTPGVLSPDDGTQVESFTADPWPTWILRCRDGTRVRHELFVRHGSPLVAMSWRLAEPRPGVSLHVRPFISGRDYHTLHHENGALRFEPQQRDGVLAWRTYDGVPDIISCANARYRHDPNWYRNFQYDAERERGLDFVEDLAAPGVLRWDISSAEAVWILGAGVAGRPAMPPPTEAARLLNTLRDAERARRAAFATPLDRAADAYLVRRGSGKTIVAGYPWFTDWGRDTFIALRGLCLATQRYDDALAILLEWSGAVSEGMLPNRFPDAGETPEYNAVDASLWYVIAVHEYLALADAGLAPLSAQQRKRLDNAIVEIVTGYEHGTRFGIRCDDDGLLGAGQPGVQLTWMDAKVGDWVVTPRIGKPVEVQALWLNALWCARRLSERWSQLLERGRESFGRRFWNEQGGCLYDVVDCDHQPGTVDGRFRPNQIFAVGGLPMPIVEGPRARRIVDAVEARLWTPLGLRSLAPDEKDFAPHYRGGVRERDGAYHQGTVWPWLIGPFVEAWLRVRGGAASARREARERFLRPLCEHLQDAGVGHVSEVADAVAPHVPGGCPWQAWSLSELIRLERVILAEPSAVPRPVANRGVVDAPATVSSGNGARP